MRAIDPSLVDEVWREVISYPPGKAGDEAREFLERQPHVAGFCQVVTKEFDLPVQKAALGLTFLLFKILEASLGAPFPPVTQRRIRQAYDATTEWLERESEFPHPHLVQHLLTVFYGGDPKSAEYDPEVKASLFLLLKTLADALDLGEVA